MSECPVRCIHHCLVGAWATPLDDRERQASWQAYVAGIHSSIVRVRLAQGADFGTLGDHLYRPTDQMRRSA